MAKCDICGATAPIYDMADLVDSYRTQDISSVCRACETWANKELWKIRDENSAMLKARICERAGRKKQVSWWRRIFSANVEVSHARLEKPDKP